jgi:hypothetical protein
MTLPGPHIEFEREFSERLTVHKNLGQEVVVTTVDKVKLCLIENRECLGAQKEWVMPMSLGIAFGTTLIAAQFRDVVFKADVWQALYIFGTIGCLIWFARTALAAWRSRSRGGIDEVVSRLKTEGVGEV